MIALRTLRFALQPTAALLLPVCLLTACKVGPDYQRPAPLGTNSMPLTFTQPSSTNDVEWKPSEPAAHLPRDGWWKLFADPDLDRLEALAAGDNQQLAAVLARFEATGESMKIARADLFPQVELDPAYTRQRTSYNQPLLGHAAGTAATYSTYLLALQAGWEVDLWGRVRRAVESARAQLAASADDVQSARLAIQADLATDYFTIRALDAEEALLRRTIDAYQRALELTLNRRRGGIASDLDVSEAETQLRNAQAELPSLRLQRAQLLHALATLCGQPATDFRLGPPTAAAVPLPAVPVTLPSELLERRPDVAGAEERMAAANAQVGVAQSAFYPRVRFNGLVGFQSVSASTWLDWPSRLWAVGPAIQLPLFTGGRNRAELALARATYAETVANYRQTVLGAFQEVQDQLAAQQLLAAQLSAENQALAAAQHTLDIAHNRYKAGLVTYLEVATAQSAALNIERTVVQLRGQKLATTVGLIRALGGGWEEDGRAKENGERVGEVQRQ